MLKSSYVGLVLLGLVGLGCNASVEEIKPSTQAPEVRQEERAVADQFKNAKPQDMQKMMREQQEKAKSGGK